MGTAQIVFPRLHNDIFFALFVCKDNKFISLFTQCTETSQAPGGINLLLRRSCLATNIT